jgi:hypothetical protein
MTAELSINDLSEIAAPIPLHLNGRGGWSLHKASRRLSEPRTVQTNFCANYMLDAWPLDISVTNDGRIFQGSNTIQNFWVSIFTQDAPGTTLPLVCVYRHEDPIRYESRTLTGPQVRELPTESSIQSPVQALIEQVRKISGLTLEEISPLLGVSRRSLQHWLSGHQISARNEQRLRALADTLSSLPTTADPATSRHRLLQRKADGVRAYDLLAEGQFSAAVELITGRGPTPGQFPPNAIKAPPSLLTPLTRMSTLHGGPSSLSGRVDTRRSGRLKR